MKCDEECEGCVRYREPQQRFRIQRGGATNTSTLRYLFILGKYHGASLNDLRIVY